MLIMEKYKRQKCPCCEDITPAGLFNSERSLGLGVDDSLNNSYSQLLPGPEEDPSPSQSSSVQNTSWWQWIKQFLYKTVINGCC